MRSLFPVAALCCACSTASPPKAPDSAAPEQPLARTAQGDAPVPASAATLQAALARSVVVFAGIVEQVETWTDACNRYVALSADVELAVLGTVEDESLHWMMLATPLEEAPSRCAGGQAPHVGSEVAPAFRVGQRLLLALSRDALEAERPDGSKTRGSRIAAIDTVDAVPSFLDALPRAPRHELTGLPAARERFRVDGEVAIGDSGMMWQRGASEKPLPLKQAERYCADLTLAGHDDWRLPSLYELIRVLDFQRKEPALDPAVFPAPKTGLLWSSTAWAGEPWVLVLDDGGLHWTHYDDPSMYGSYFARCVRPHEGRAVSATATPPRVVANAASIDDLSAGLSWAPQLAGKTMTWAEAKAHCAASTQGGQDDWRLPEIKELLILNQHACPGELPVTWSAGSPWDVGEGQEDGVWSATAYADGTAWRTNTVCGPHYWPEDGAERFQVLCVRDRPAEQASLRAGASRYPSGHAYAIGSQRDGKRHGRWRYHRDHGGAFLELTFDHGKLHGIATSHAASGKKLRQGRYVDGAPDGEWTRWYEDGTRRRVRSYVDGKVEGVERSFRADGKLESEERYVAGALEGQALYVSEDGEKFYSTYRGGVLHGPHRSLHRNGKLSESGTHRNGKRHGRHREWHENGRLSYEAHYLDGEIEGRVRGFYEDGRVQLEGELKGGRGKLRYLHPNGRVQKEVAHLDHRQHDEVITYDEKGRKLSEEHYDRGEPVGVRRSWYENGQLESEESYRDGERHGIARRWSERGKLLEETHWSDGRRSGRYRQWRDDGSLAIEGSHNAKGNRHGLWRAFDRDGKEVERLVYEDGEPLREQP